MTVHEWHVNHHSRPDLEVVDCPECRDAWRACQRKIRHLTRDEATAAADADLVHNRRPKVIYTCRACGFFHLTTARGKHQLKKAEKRRRKLLRSVDAA
jgi:hypothetical protein